MTVNEAYQYAQIRLNRNQSNYGDNIPKYVFVSTFNSAQLLWCEDRFKLDETNITRKDELQQLLKSETLKGVKKENYYEFNLPEDYFHYKRSVSYTPCIMTNWLKKEGDINVLLKDEFWKPSLEWGETLCTIVGNKLRVYFDNFNIDYVILEYYRYPVNINMSDGFSDVNNNPTVNVDPEFKGVNLIEILNYTCQILSGDTSDQWNYQVHAQQNQNK